MTRARRLLAATCVLVSGMLAATAVALALGPPPAQPMTPDATSAPRPTVAQSAHCVDTRAAARDAQPDAPLAPGIAATTPLPSPSACASDLQVTAERAEGPAAGLLLHLTVTDRLLASRVEAAGRTDHDGKLRVPLASIPPVEHGTTCVDVGFATGGAYAVQVDRETAQLALFTPARGRVHVAVLEHDGAAVRGPAVVELRVISATPPADRPHHFDLRDGSVEFDVEAAGLPLELTCCTADGRRTTTQSLFGPAFADQLVAAELRLPARRELSLRAIGPDGIPLADARLEVRLARTTLRFDDAAISDHFGVLRFPASPRLPETARLSISWQRDDGALLLGELRADLTMAAKPHLGDVWLTEAPPLVEGTCTDHQGRPLAGIELQAQINEPGAAPLGIGGSTWRDLALAPVTSDADGRFVVRGPQVPGARLQLSLRQRPALRFAFTAGDRELKVVVPPRGVF